MKVFLTSANPYDDCDPPGWLKSRNTAANDICTDDPAEADVILFVESHHTNDPYFRKVIEHELYKRYRNKCVLYHDADLTITTLPTISPSVEAWQYDPRHKRSFHYIARVTENETIDQSPVNFDVEREYLYSFIGSKTHKLRGQILDIEHAPDAYVKDTTGLNAWELSEVDKIVYEREYFDVMNKSAFILTPRGIGPSSYRLFESMQLGRTPVIISDEWVEVPGIKWDECSIRIPQARINEIPAILRERAKDAVELGKRARKIWEQCFSPGVSLNQIAFAAKELIQHQYSFSDAVKDYSQFIRSPWHFKNLLRFKKNQLKQLFPEKTPVFNMPQSEAVAK